MSKIVQLNQKELDVISGSFGGVVIGAVACTIVGSTRSERWSFAKGVAVGWVTCEAKYRIKNSQVMGDCKQMVADFRAQQADPNRCYVDDLTLISI